MVRKGTLAVLLSASLFVLLLNGCSKEYLLQDEEGTLLGTPKQKYLVLSFFFDGVPDPDRKDDTEQGKKRGGPALHGKERLTRYVEHGPFAAKLCEGCHERGTNKLVVPLEELCTHCHTFRMEKRVIHGPLASGNCRTCHEPHGSSYRFLLVSESKDFCFYCHDRKSVTQREVHKSSDAECTQCHDAHMSDKDFLLK